MPPDPINWATISPQGGQGDRHHRAAPTPLTVWACPSCGRENHSRLELGCECGAGKPGYKAEVKPPTPTGRITRQPDSRDYLTSQDAFTDWAIAHNIAPIDRALCLEAWKAGMEYATQRQPAQQPPATADLPLVGTPESRTLAAALTYFLDHVLSESPEECEDGTWITPEQAKALIQQLSGD
jgi:hypothetical protein